MVLLIAAERLRFPIIQFSLRLIILFIFIFIYQINENKFIFFQTMTLIEFTK